MKTFDLASVTFLQCFCSDGHRLLRGSSARAVHFQQSLPDASISIFMESLVMFILDETQSGAINTDCSLQFLIQFASCWDYFNRSGTNEYLYGLLSIRWVTTCVLDNSFIYFKPTDWNLLVELDSCDKPHCPSHKWPTWDNWRELFIYGMIWGGLF